MKAASTPLTSRLTMQVLGFPTTGSSEARSRNRTLREPGGETTRFRHQLLPGYPVRAIPEVGCEQAEGRAEIHSTAQSRCH